MERIIRVTGRGNIAVKPDTIRLSITLEDIRKTYEETLKLSTIQTEKLKDCFETLGFDRSDLKTTYFNVDTEYESYKDKNGNWKRRFMGYKFKHRFKIQFTIDNEKLGKILYALAHSETKPKFTISYTVKDIEACKNQLLAKAVADSKQKAEILASAAGTKLGLVTTIDYSWGEMEIFTNPIRRMTEACDMIESCASGSYDMDIEPDDIDVTDTVTVVWELE